MTKRDINIRIYYGTGDKWHSIAIISLIGHMTSLGLYDSPDSVMEAAQNYLQSRLAACSTDRLFHSPNLHRLYICGGKLNPEGRGVEQSISQWSWVASLTACIPKRSEINRL